MSSLLQFSGRITKKGVGLLFQLTDKSGYKNLEMYPCPDCGRDHPVLWEAFRKPRGMFGPWVVFQYNGEEHVPDLSIPISVNRIPRDARQLWPIEASLYWHS